VSRPDADGQAERERFARDSSALRITLLRHGEPDWSPRDGRTPADPPLTAYGHAQARVAAAALAKARRPFEAIYVSPLRRAQETAAPLAEATGLEPVTVTDLREIDSGAGGLTLEEVDRYFAQSARRPLSEHWDGMPRGESFRAFHRRVVGAIAELLAGHGVHALPHDEFTVWSQPAQPLSIAIVAHGGTNAVLATHLLGVPPVPWEWLRFESQLAAWSELSTRGLGDRGAVFALTNFNELDHLRAAGLY
jgi:broad specificity phosphatase PhoE